MMVAAGANRARPTARELRERARHQAATKRTAKMTSSRSVPAFAALCAQGSSSVESSIMALDQAELMAKISEIISLHRGCAREGTNEQEGTGNLPATTCRKPHDAVTGKSLSCHNLNRSGSRKDRCV